MKTIRRICAVLIGFVFIGAGLLKLMDPVGAGLVVGEYFKFLHLGFMVPASDFFGVFMALVESLVGVMLISGVFRKGTAIVSGALILVFTGLTLAIWVDNPNMDCGCFGEAVHLTHFQSFIKNVALCLLWVVAFVPLPSSDKPRQIKYVSFGIASLSVLLFALWSLMSIPPVDFTPFAPGAVLMQAQSPPEPDAPLLSVCNSEGEYCDEELAEGAVLLLTVYDMNRMPEHSFIRLLECAAAASAAGMRPVLITAEDCQSADYTSDRRTLMTVNRSNGGATLLRDGMIVAKWPYRSLPGTEKLAGLMEYNPAEAMLQENTPKRLKFQGYLLYVFAVLLLL